MNMFRVEVYDNVKQLDVLRLRALDHSSAIEMVRAMYPKAPYIMCEQVIEGDDIAAVLALMAQHGNRPGALIAVREEPRQ